MVNKLILIGRMGGDPEVNMGQNGPRVRFSVAVNRMVNDEEKTTWIWITAFGRAAESLEKHGEKGRQVYLEGRLDTYGDDNRLSVTVNRVQYLSARKQSGGPKPDTSGSYGDFYKSAGDDGSATPF